MSKLKETLAWKALEAHYETVKDLHMRDLFTEDPERFNRFSVRSNDLLLDFSKNRITAETLRLLLDLAGECKVQECAQRMFSGEKINFTEQRAVLHTALRNRSNAPVYVDGENVMPEINAVLEHMRHFV